LVELVAVAHGGQQNGAGADVSRPGTVQLILVVAVVEMERAMLPMFLEQAAQELSSSNTQ
jgi:hypothetical protein